MINDIINLFRKRAWVAASMAIALWLTLYHAAEFLLTEHFFILNRLRSEHAAISLAAITLPVFFIYRKDALKKSNQVVAKTTALATLAILVAAVVGVGLYQDYYSWLQRHPKIKEVSRNWSIQGDRIIITGKNFGQVWQKGTVKVSNLEFNIRSWDEERVVAEQPLTQDYQRSKLILTNYHGNEAVVEPFELKDPAEVL